MDFHPGNPWCSGCDCSLRPELEQSVVYILEQSHPNAGAADRLPPEKEVA